MKKVVLVEFIVACLVTLFISSHGSENLCECGILAQLSGSSYIAHLTQEPLVSETDECLPDEVDDCRELCSFKLDLDDRVLWSSVFQNSCQFFLESSKNSSKKTSLPYIKGYLQGQFRSCDGVWKPLRSPFRKSIACYKPRVYQRHSRNAPENSVDAQESVSQLESQTTSQVDEDVTPILLDATFVKAALKAFGFSGPYLDGFFRLIDQVDLRSIFNQLNLSWLTNLFSALNRQYSSEMDVAKCYMEYLVYTVFNNRYKGTQRSFSSSRNGNLVEALGSALGDQNMIRLIKSITKALPQNSSIMQGSNVPTKNSNSHFEDVLMRIGRIYLKNYLANLAGGKPSVKSTADPDNNPDNLSSMLEEATKPFLMSVFGVVPGVPASGHADRRNWFVHAATDDDVTIKNMLHSLPDPSTNELADVFRPSKTGNFMFDIGNQMFFSFQRASDSTHGLYCAKQYVVNRFWDVFRGRVRTLLRAITSL